MICFTDGLTVDDKKLFIGEEDGWVINFSDGVIERKIIGCRLGCIVDFSKFLVDGMAVGLGKEITIGFKECIAVGIADGFEDCIANKVPVGFVVEFLVSLSDGVFAGDVDNSVGLTVDLAVELRNGFIVGLGDLRAEGLTVGCKKCWTTGFTEECAVGACALGLVVDFIDRDGIFAGTGKGSSVCIATRSTVGLPV